MVAEPIGQPERQHDRILAHHERADRRLGIPPRRDVELVGHLLKQSHPPDIRFLRPILPPLHAQRRQIRIQVTVALGTPELSGSAEGRRIGLAVKVVG